MQSSTSNDGWVPPSVWGPVAWNHFYHTAAGYDPSRRDAYQAFYTLIPPTLRCDECSLNALQLWARRPVTSYLGSRERLLEWVWLQHMDVRKHQKVRTIPDFSLADVFRRYLPPDTGAAMAVSHAHGMAAEIPAPSAPQASIAIFASAKSHLHSSYNGGGPVPATSFVPVAAPTSYPSSSERPAGAPIALFARDYTMQPASATTKVTAQSIDGYVREQAHTAAIGFKGVQAKTVGFSRCCKNRVQASAATTQAFVV